MALDFPASPAVGQVFSAGNVSYTWNGYAWMGGPQLVPAHIISDTPPANPIQGQTWWESDTGMLFVAYNDGNTTQWVQINAMAGAGAHGQCRYRLEGLNGVLRPYGGRWLIINGKSELVPAAGVSLVPAGLGTGGIYNIYAYMNAGVMTLEASATGHSTHTDGVEIKTGDPTRTLVGMSRAGSATSWTPNAVNVVANISWFNRSLLAGQASGSGSIVNAASAQEFSSATRVYVMNWAGEAINLVHAGFVYSSVIGTPGLSLWVDENNVGAGTNFTIPAATYYHNTSFSWTGATVEGYHYCNVRASTPGGTLTGVYQISVAVWG